MIDHTIKEDTAFKISSLYVNRLKDINRKFSNVVLMYKDFETISVVGNLHTDTSSVQTFLGFLKADLHAGFRAVTFGCSLR